MPKFLLPCADQGIRSRCVVPGEQVVIMDVEGDDFSVRFTIIERLLPCSVFLLDAADKVIELQCLGRLGKL